jgi:hypothetical protein
VHQFDTFNTLEVLEVGVDCQVADSAHVVGLALNVDGAKVADGNLLVKGVAGMKRQGRVGKREKEEKENRPRMAGRTYEHGLGVARLRPQHAFERKELKLRLAR